jgi:hypothetical protein
MGAVPWPAVDPAAKPLEFGAQSSSVYRAVIGFLGGTSPGWSFANDEDESRRLVDRLLECWRLLPGVGPEAFDDLADRMHTTQRARLRDCWLAVIAFSKTQHHVARAAVGAMEASGLAYSLLKGIATGYCLYAQPWHRIASDLDVGVPRQNLVETERLMASIGFQPAQKNDRTQRFELADPRLRARVESQHYELGFLAKRARPTNLDDATLAAIRREPWAGRLWLDGADRPWCYSLVDVHHALSHDLDLEALLASSVRVTRDAVTATVPDDAWLATHLVFKIYWEGVHNYGKGLYQYADLARVVARMTDASAVEFVGIMEHYNMLAGAHYVLRRVALFGTTPGAELQRFMGETLVAPSTVERADDPFTRPVELVPGDVNDLGDMWPRLWGQR